MKWTIVGAGSAYTPELIEKLGELKDSLPVREIALYDIDAERLNLSAGFAARFAKGLGLKTAFTAHTDLDGALRGADFVIAQIRVGGNRARMRDEKLPLSMGLIGQETTGAGGFLNAMRTIPEMLKIARAVERICPDAWIINYTNPTGLVAEAVLKHSGAKFVGLCSGGFFGRDFVSRALHVDWASVRYDIAGLNHMNFMYNFTIGGRPITREEFALAARQVKSVDQDLIVALGALPSPYLQYYFHTDRKLEELKAQKLCRAEQVLQIEDELMREMRDETLIEKPKALIARGGGGYSDIALGAIGAIYRDRDLWTVANVLNKGALPFLPDDAVIETACVANAAGFKPLTVAPPPQAVRGLIAAVKSYETLAVQAAVTRDEKIARLALMAHPLVGEWDQAKEIAALALKNG